MAIGQATWRRLHTLAQRARLAGTARQQLEIRLSPEESTALADVLEGALRMMAAVMGKPELDLSEPSAEELAYLAMQGGAFDWLADEPDLYSDDDLKERFSSRLGRSPDRARCSVLRRLRSGDRPQLGWKMKCFQEVP